MLDSWSKATTERLEELRRPLEVEALTRLAHTMKGSSASVGARRLAALAAEFRLVRPVSQVALLCAASG